MLSPIFALAASCGIANDQPHARRLRHNRCNFRQAFDQSGEHLVGQAFQPDICNCVRLESLTYSKQRFFANAAVPHHFPRELIGRTNHEHHAQQRHSIQRTVNSAISENTMATSWAKLRWPRTNCVSGCG